MARRKKVKFKADKHILTPKHQKASAKEKSAVLAKYHIAEKQLPKIFSTDSAISQLDPKPGDLIRITRKSPTRGESVFYRVVVDV